MQEMWVDGKRTAGASGRTIAVHDPATEEIIDLVPAAGQEEVAAAVGAASAAFAEWRRVPAGTRAELLHEVAVRLTSPSKSLDEEMRLIARLKPRDNLIGQRSPADEEPIPF